MKFIINIIRKLLMPRKKKDQKMKLGQELIESVKEVLDAEQNNNQVQIKEEKMSQVQEVCPVETVYTNKALSTCQIGNEWYLVEVEYNPETKEVGPLKMEPVGTERMTAMERFKIEVINRKVIRF